MRKISAVILALVIIITCFSFAGCGNDKHPELVLEFDPTASSGIGGTVKIELYPEWSPNSVNFVISLAQRGLYDGVTAFKCIGYNTVAFGDAWNRKKIKEVIEGEFAANDKKDAGVSFENGVVGMYYNGDAYDSCYGSFFVCLNDDIGKEFDGKFAPIGRVTEGIEVLYAASGIDSSAAMNYEPFYTVRIKKASVLLHGKTYDLPVTKERTDFPGVETGD